MCQFPLSKSVKLPHSLVDGLVCWFDCIFELLLPVVICAVSPCRINGQASSQYRSQTFFVCSQNRKVMISPYAWLHGRLGHSCLCVIWVGVALWVRNWLQNKYVKSISMFTTKCSWSVIMRISVWTQNSGIQIEHILLDPLAKLYFG